MHRLVIAAAGAGLAWWLLSRPAGAGGCPGCGPGVGGLGTVPNTQSTFDARPAPYTVVPVGAAAFPAWMTSFDARRMVVGQRPRYRDRPLGFPGRPS